MPVSDSGNLPAIANTIENLQPKGIIELGVGFGLMGAMARNYLDARWGRCKPEQWQHIIQGVEAFESYSNPCWELYDNVAIGDFAEWYKNVVGWDLVLMIDSLEHVEKPTAYEILDYLVDNNKWVIVSVPIGYCPQGECFGNPYEAHRAVWTAGDFIKYDWTVLHQGVCCVVLLKGKQNG